MNQKASPLATAYLRFLQLAKAVDSTSNRPSLDANESALLDALAVHWFAGSPLTVMQAMGLARLGSPATVHRRIARLRKIGMVTGPLTTDTHVFTLLAASIDCAREQRLDSWVTLIEVCGQ